MKVSVYNQKAENVGTLELPKEIFEVPMNSDLVHQALTAQLAISRVPHAATKGRGEVRGGGKKPWKQKGTGRARHGSIRSPIWRKGGIVFGPTIERNYEKKLNKKMKKKALFMVLSEKAKGGEIVVLDDLRFTEAKTKNMAEIMGGLAAKLVIIPKEAASAKKNNKTTSFPKRMKALIIIPAKDDMLARASRNLPNIDILRADSLNIKDLLSFPYLILLKESVTMMKKTYAK